MVAVNQKLADEAVRHRLFLSRFSTRQANLMLNMLRQSRREIALNLLEALEDGNLTPQNFTVARLQSLMRSTTNMMGEVYNDIFGQLGTNMEEFSVTETAYQNRAFNWAVPAQIFEYIPMQAITSAQVIAAATARPMQGVLLKNWADKMTADTVRKVQNAAQQGFLQGESYTDIIRRVQGTKANNYADGALGASGRDLAAVVKSTVSHYAAEAREQMAQANDDLIKCRQWLSTLDNRTSHMCIIRDRLLYTKDKKPQPIGHNVPYGAGPSKLHYCCRSTETWIIKSFEDLGLSVGELSTGTRASMNGQVPADMTYSKWLKRQPLYAQEQVLGVTRAQMLNAGKASVGDFFTDRGEWIDLKQLKILDDEATK